MNNFIENNQIFIFSFLAIIVFVLATYLGFLLNKIRIQKNLAQIKEQKVEQLKKQREDSILESIRLISRAVIYKQCEVSEGCIRIKKLLDLIDFKYDESLRPINELYEQLEEFPYLDERNRLSKQERFNQDKKRFKIEDEFGDRFKKACESLLEQIKQ